MEVFLALVSVLIALIIGLIYHSVKSKLQSFAKSKIPHIKPHFFFGNTREFRDSFFHLEFFQDVYTRLKSMGPVAGAFICTEPFVLLTDPELIKSVLLKNFDNFLNRGIYHNEEHDPASAHLVNLEDDKWRSLRNKVTPTFTSGKLKMMLPLIDDIAGRFVAAIARDSSDVHIKEIVSRFTTDVIGKTAFGIDCNSLDDRNAEFYYYGNLNFSDFNFISAILKSSFMGLARLFRLRVIKPEISEFYKRIIEETIKFREENEVKQNDFMSLMIALKNSSDPITFNQILAQTTVFFLAGYETTATTLTYCLYELSQNAEIQAKARESVEKVLAQHGGEYTYEAVSKMSYLEQCLNETMRKYPPFVFLRRVVKSDFKVPATDVVLKAGMKLIVPVYAIHHDPDIYPEPDRFDPARFTPEETAKRSRFTFLPFGEGPRICIGERFALVEMKLALAKLLMSYKFVLDTARTSTPLRFDRSKIILTPANEIFIQFESL